jgi:CRP-like cAMP-binding protein
MQPSSSNRLLAALPAPERARLEPLLERVELPFRRLLVEPNRPIEHVYFIESGAASILSDLARTRIEVATVGNEGMVGLPVFLGTGRVPLTALVQVAGLALRMPSSSLSEATERSPRLHDLLNRYTQALMYQIAQSAACRSLHAVEQRCIRWLLMTHDRVEGDRFSLTQEFLAQMIGVRRATVSETQSELKRRGLIDYSRGEVVVRDRRGLEAAVCECYELIAHEHERVLGLDGPLAASPMFEQSQPPSRG